jgi:hypothetical protein
VRRGKILWIHGLGIESQSAPVLIRDSDLAMGGTLYNVGLVISVDNVRMWQHQKIIAGLLRFRRRPPDLLIVAWHIVLALSLAFAIFADGWDRGGLFLPRNFL